MLRPRLFALAFLLASAASQLEEMPASQLDEQPATAPEAALPDTQVPENVESALEALLATEMVAEAGDASLDGADLGREFGNPYSGTAYYDQTDGDYAEDSYSYANMEPYYAFDPASEGDYSDEYEYGGDYGMAHRSHHHRVHYDRQGRVISETDSEDEYMPSTRFLGATSAGGPLLPLLIGAALGALCTAVAMKRKQQVDAAKRAVESAMSLVAAEEGKVEGAPLLMKSNEDLRPLI